MDILQKIRNHKEEEVQVRKSLYPIKLLQESIYYDSEVVSYQKISVVRTNLVSSQSLRKNHLQKVILINMPM